MSTRAWRRLAITLGVVVVLLAVLDRVGLWVAEYETGKTIQNSQHLKSRPDVQLSGFPFLTQLISADFDKVTVDATDVPVHARGRLLVVHTMHVVLDNVSTSRSFTSFHTKQATATGLVTLGDLSTTLRTKLTYAGSGRIAASRSVTVFGQRVDGTVTARPKLAGSGLTFDEVHVSGPGGVSGPATSVLTRVFALTLPLRNIPFHLRVQSLQVDGQGVHITLTGRDITYTRP